MSDMLNDDEDAIIVCAPSDEAALKGREPGFETPCEGGCGTTLFCCDETIDAAMKASKPGAKALLFCLPCAFKKMAELADGEPTTFVPLTAQQVTAILKYSEGFE